MELSGRERRMLEEMETHLLAEDPGLASSLGEHRLRPGVQAIVAAVALAGGVALMAVGLSLGQLTGILVALVGFVVILAATVVADELRLRNRGGTVTPVKPVPRTPPASG